MQQTFSLPADYTFFPVSTRPAPARSFADEYEQGTSEMREIDSCAQEMPKCTIVYCSSFLGLALYGLSQGWLL